MAADEVGIAAILVHALNGHDKAFYLGAGFAETMVEPMTLFLRAGDAMALIGEGWFHFLAAGGKGAFASVEGSGRKAGWNGPVGPGDAPGWPLVRSPWRRAIFS